MINITGMWMHKSKKGEYYYKGRFGECEVLLFKNSKVEGKQPTHRLCFKKIERAELPDHPPEKSIEVVDEDLPF